MKDRLRAKRESGTRKAGKLARRAEVNAERYFFRRLDRLVPVRRFVISWLLLLVLLCGCLVGQIRALDSQFKTLKPTAGGVYTEGILGDFTNSNPLYATSQVDESVSKLLYASLFKYDDRNRLVGDLALGYEIDSSGKVYTVKLRPNLFWHDGEKLTASDVVFTYKMIQNPDALSVLYKGWQGVAVAALDEETVTFTLPNVLGSFPYHMTNGIVPEHILKQVAPAEMRSNNFNTTQPIGSGPFKWKAIEVTGDTPEKRQARIALDSFKRYHEGEPKLAEYIVHTFHDADQMKISFREQELTGANFVDPPEELLNIKNVRSKSFMMSAADMVFFKSSSPVLSNAAVRKALVQGVNVQAIIESLGYVTHPVREPFLMGQLGYDPSLVQAGFDTAAAQQLLEADGWKLNDKGIRVKNGVALRFNLHAQDMAESRLVANQLVSAWRSIGARPELKLESSSDLQRTISSDQYDALLYGISIGVDPDVFVYWHSSQTDARSSGLNFSEYKNRTADLSLEAGRTRIEPELRAVKYKPFLQAWQQDVPALGLYQPRYLYLTHGEVFGLNERVLNTNTDRYGNVANWQIRQVDTTE